MYLLFAKRNTRDWWHGSAVVGLTTKACQAELEPQALMKVEGENQFHRAVAVLHVCMASTPPQDTSYMLIIIKFKSKRNTVLSKAIRYHADRWGVC